LLDYKAHPELDEIDKLVVEYAIAVTNGWNRTRDEIFVQLKAHFSEAQIVELTWRTALCGAFNRFNDILQLDIEEGVAVRAGVGRNKRSALRRSTADRRNAADALLRPTMAPVSMMKEGRPMTAATPPASAKTKPPSSTRSASGWSGTCGRTCTRWRRTTSTPPRWWSR
jgi:hypothetical protein